MDEKSTKKELEAAYSSLAKADAQIKNLLIERRQAKMVLQILESGGYITDGKLDEAQEFARSFCCG